MLYEYFCLQFLNYYKDVNNVQNFFKKLSIIDFLINLDEACLLTRKNCYIIKELVHAFDRAYIELWST